LIGGRQVVMDRKHQKTAPDGATVRRSAQPLPVHLLGADDAAAGRVEAVAAGMGAPCDRFDTIDRLIDSLDNAAPGCVVLLPGIAAPEASESVRHLKNCPAVGIDVPVLVMAHKSAAGDGAAAAEGWMPPTASDREVRAQLGLLLTICGLRLELAEAQRQHTRSSVGLVISSVAHQLNNPMTAILGFSSSLLDRIRLGEEMQAAELEECLAIINAEAARCRDIVKDFSAFGKEGVRPEG